MTQNWSKFKSSWYWQDDLKENTGRLGFRPTVSLGCKRRAEIDQNITEQIRKTWKCHSLCRTNYRWHLSEPSPPCKSLLCRGIWQKKMFRIWRGQEKETTLRRVLGKWFCVDKLDRSEVGQDWRCGENTSMIIGKEFLYLITTSQIMETQTCNSWNRNGRTRMSWFAIAQQGWPKQLVPSSPTDPTRWRL